MYLREKDIINNVVAYVKDKGVAYYPELKDMLENNFQLTYADLEEVGGGYKHRIWHILTNLKSNRTIIKQYSDIVHVEDGIAMETYANKNNLTITDNGRKTRPTKRAKTKKARVASYEIVNRLNILYDQSKISDSMVHALYIRNGVRDSIVAAVVKKPIAQGDREALDAAIHAEVSKYTPKAA